MTKYPFSNRPDSGHVFWEDMDSVFVFFLKWDMRHMAGLCVGELCFPNWPREEMVTVCPNVTRSLPVWGEGVLAQGLCARASPRKKRKRYTSLSHSKCLIPIIILLCVYPCWHMRLIHLNAAWFSNIWKYIFLDFPSSPLVKALCTSNAGAQIWFLDGELDPTCSTVRATKKERKKTHFLPYWCLVTWIVSDSLRPYGLQPARLRRHWDSPGKNTGVGCHFLLQPYG